MEVRIAISIKGPLLEGKAPEVVQQYQEAAITEAVMFLLPKIKARTPQGASPPGSNLLKSIQTGFPGKGTPVMKGIIATAQPYGEVAEKGRRPGKGMPPKGSLVRWLEVKLGLDEKTAQRIEFVVRRKIGRKGFEGAHMFEGPLDEYWPQLRDIFGRHGFEIARELNG